MNRFEQKPSYQIPIRLGLEVAGHDEEPFNSEANNIKYIALEEVDKDLFTSQEPGSKNALGIGNEKVNDYGEPFEEILT